MTKKGPVSAAEFIDRYERLRHRVTEGGPGHNDGLVLLRRQGLHAWMTHVAIEPLSGRPESSEPLAFGPSFSQVQRSPVVSLCADMMLATLKSKEVQ
jgi:hypothetical protein